MDVIRLLRHNHPWIGSRSDRSPWMVLSRAEIVFHGKRYSILRYAF